jgi:IS30 family transposase
VGGGIVGPQSFALDIYIAHPYHSWERGLNEHTNGLIRQYQPKKTPFDRLTSKQLDQIVDKINNRDIFLPKAV